MKIIVLLLVLIITGLASYGCPVCERANAKISFGILGHGTLPTSNWEYVAVWVVIASVAFTFFYSLKLLIKPSENNKDHIKYSILNSESQ